jgi:hypothetical protein
MGVRDNRCSDITVGPVIQLQPEWIPKTFKAKFGKVSTIHIFHCLCICAAQFLRQLPSRLKTNALEYCSVMM